MFDKTFVRIANVFRQERRELCTMNFWWAVATEILATFLLIFTCLLVGVQWGPTSPGDDPAGPIKAALTTGLTIMCLIEAFGHISGAHMNPAVTVAFAVLGRIYPIKALLYMVAQCAGSVAGAAVVYAVTPASRRGQLSALGVHPEISVWQALGVELCITATMIYTTLGAIEYRFKSISLPTFPIGMSVSAGIMAGFYTSGGCMNPIRQFGPSAVVNAWDNHWIYWVGPLLGSVVATLTYQHAFLRTAQPSPDKQETPSALTALMKGLQLQPNQEKETKQNVSTNGHLPHIQVEDGQGFKLMTRSCQGLPVNPDDVELDKHEDNHRGLITSAIHGCSTPQPVRSKKHNHAEETASKPNLGSMPMPFFLAVGLNSSTCESQENVESTRM